MLEALEAGQFRPILSEPLMEEILDVLCRPRIAQKYNLELRDIAEFVALLEEKAIQVQPTGQLRICRDPRDDVVLETAILGKADYVVTRDDDLKRDLQLILKMRAHGVAVLSVGQFLQDLERTARKRGRRD